MRRWTSSSARSSRSWSQLSGADEIEQGLLAQAPRRFCPLEQLGCQIALVAVQLQDTLLDAVLHDQAVDRDRPLLADPVRPVRGLVLDGRVPPGVEMHDIIGRGQVQPR